MKFVPTASLLFMFVFCFAPAWAVDYKVDPTFNPQLSTSDSIFDVFVQPDGKLIAGGRECSSSQCIPYIKRLNPDGTVDPTFVAGISPPNRDGTVSSIKPLPNGQFLITGVFNVGTVLSNYARINANGSLDPTLAPGYLDQSYGAQRIEPMPDGKMVVCTERTVNSQLYKIAHRLNADGSFDPTFRITTINGFCENLLAVTDGKLIISSRTFSFQPDEQSLRRLNADGSEDPTFNSPLPIGTVSYGLTGLPDGKMLLSAQSDNEPRAKTKRLHADGTVDLEIPLCGGAAFLQLANGSIVTRGCRRWESYFGVPLDFMKVSPTGQVDPTLDTIYFDNYGDVSGFRDAGSDRYYVFGGFRAIQRDYTRGRLQRLIPNTAPLKAKFDFDGDGRSDIAVYRPSDGVWYLNQSSAGIAYQQWGFPTDKPAASHFDNDGKTDIAVYRDGVWHGWSSVNGWKYLNMGQAGDKPMVGNFEDERADLEDWAVRGVRGGVTKWFVRDGWTVFNPDYPTDEITLPGEQASDKPVVGDFNGDSRDDFGYFRAGFWYTVDRRAYQAPKSFQWGIAGDIPVSGDYDGDRQTDYAIFRPSTGEWWVKQSANGIFVLRFGLNGDIPVPADYDGDGKVDIAIYRDGVWWQFLSATASVQVVHWGLAGDIPIPAQNQ